MDQSNRLPSAPQSKKPYRAPVLETFGDLRTVTANTGTMSSIADGGGPPGKSKTG